MKRPKPIEVCLFALKHAALASSTEYVRPASAASRPPKFEIRRHSEVTPGTIMRRCRQDDPRKITWSDLKTPNGTYGWEVWFDLAPGRRIQYSFRTFHPYSAFELVVRRGATRGQRLTDLRDGIRAALSIFDQPLPPGWRKADRAGGDTGG